jgi:polyisoprenyl-phosphate glycosyltransferase
MPRLAHVQTEEPEICVVVPLYNEEENIAELYRRLSETLRALEEPYEIVFVNDGSRDATPRLIDALRDDDAHVVPLHLTRNFGHQAAVSAGLDHARGRSVMVMDGDLQDPPEVIPQFLRLWREGHDVVYAVRRHRKEGLLKRVGYASFYRILNAISDLDMPLDSGDFCLMDRRVVDTLRRLPERMRFVRGLRTYVGFRQIGLDYDRAAREKGRPKYSFRALLGLAIDGLVSFSSYPLRLVTYLGVTTAIVAVVMMVCVFALALVTRSAPHGWASTMVVVLFMGSVQLLSLGIIGEYIRLIFLEAKERPTYLVMRDETELDRYDHRVTPRPAASRAGDGPPGKDGRENDHELA